MLVGGLRRGIACALLGFVLVGCGGGGSGGNGGSGSSSSNSPPRFTSPTAFTFNENEMVGFNLDVTDPDGDAVTIRDETGGDGALFTVDLSTGAVRANTPNQAFDYEAPQDVDRNNVYEQAIVLSDGKTSVRVIITVTIENVDEGPVFVNAQTLNLNENQSGPVFTFTAEDPEGADVSGYRISSVSKLGETYNSPRLLAAFSIDSTTGVLTVNTPFDAEIEGSSDPINVAVAASDGAIEGFGGIDITIVDLPSRVVEGARISGRSRLAALGQTANKLGDLDGDGLEEIWISEALYAGNPEPQVETAYLVWGKTLRDALAGGPADMPVAELTASQAIRFTHESPADLDAKHSSLIAASAGDVDGDGALDILVGYREMREDRYVVDSEDGPIASIVFGAGLVGNTSGTYDLASPPALAQVDISGFSRKAAVALTLGQGDFDGDGRGDIVLGTPMQNAGWVIFGTAVDGFLVTGDMDVALAPVGEALQVYHQVPGSGRSLLAMRVAGLQDLTGDSRDELVVNGDGISPPDPNNGTPTYENGILVASGKLLADAKAARLTEVNLGDPASGTDVARLSAEQLAIVDIAVNGDVDADGLPDIALAHEKAYGKDRVATLIYGATIKAALEQGTNPSLDFSDASEGITIDLTGNADLPDEIWYSALGKYYYERPYLTDRVAFAPSFTDGPGDELVIGRPLYSPLLRLEAGAVFILRDSALTNRAEASIILTDDADISGLGRKFQGFAVIAAIGGNLFLTDLDGDGIADLSLASSTAGPVLPPLLKPSGAYYMLPGTVMQEVFASDATSYDLANSLALEAPHN